MPVPSPGRKLRQCFFSLFFLFPGAWALSAQETGSDPIASPPGLETPDVSIPHRGGSRPPLRKLPPEKNLNPALEFSGETGDTLDPILSRQKGEAQKDVLKGYMKALPNQFPGKGKDDKAKNGGSGSLYSPFLNLNLLTTEYGSGLRFQGGFYSLFRVKAEGFAPWRKGSFQYSPLYADTELGGRIPLGDWGEIQADLAGGIRNENADSRMSFFGSLQFSGGRKPFRLLLRPSWLVFSESPVAVRHLLNQYLKISFEKSIFPFYLIYNSSLNFPVPGVGGLAPQFSMLPEIGFRFHFFDNRVIFKPMFGLFFSAPGSLYFYPGGRVEIRPLNRMVLFAEVRGRLETLDQSRSLLIKEKINRFNFTPAHYWNIRGGLILADGKGNSFETSVLSRIGDLPLAEQSYYTTKDGALWQTKIEGRLFFDKVAALEVKGLLGKYSFSPSLIYLAGFSTTWFLPSSLELDIGARIGTDFLLDDVPYGFREHLNVFSAEAAFRAGSSFYVRIRPGVVIETRRFLLQASLGYTF